MALAKLIPALMLVALMFDAGLQVDREHLMAALKNAGLLGRALLANVVAVPLFGWLLAGLFRLPQDIATGFLLMAIAPGVPFVVVGARKKGGSLGFAVALALLLPLVSLVTIPPTAALVLPPGAEARIPLPQFLTTLLLFQALPLLCGIAVAARFEATAERLRRPVGLIAIVALVAVLIVLAPRLAAGIATVFGSRGMWAMLCLTLLSAIVGFLLGGPSSQDRHTLSNATTLRNVGLCILIATTSFAGTDVPAAVLTYLVVQVIVSTLVGMYFKRTTEAAA